MQKTFFFILALFLGQTLAAQKGKTKVQNDEDFYLYYGVVGLGSNLGRFQPTLRIQGSSFIYTKEQNSYLVKRSKKAKFISKGIIRQSSIDSILSLVQNLKDTTISRSNLCILSGGFVSIVIAKDGYTTKFNLFNTFDTTALKIISIINPYLPQDKKLHGSEKEIKDEEDCSAYLRKLIKDSIKKYLSEDSVLRIFEKKYDSLRIVLKDTIAVGINNINDYDHVFTSSEKQSLDSLIKDFKQATNIQIVIFTFDSSMTPKDSLEQVTQIIGIKHRINTTIGISFSYHFMHIWNDSLINNTFLYQFQTKEIIEKDFIPFFKKGELFNGTYEGLKAIIQRMKMNRFYYEQIENGK